MAAYASIRRWALPALVLFVTLPAIASEPVTYRVPIKDGHVRLSQLLDVALTELGLALRISDRMLAEDIRVVGKRGAAVVATVNAATVYLGITLHTEGEYLLVNIDRAKVRKRWNQLESWLRDTLDHPPVFALRRVDDQATGPPVVLVHGIDNNIERLRGAAQALVRRGYDAYLYEYPDDTSIEEIAGQLGPLLGGLRRKTGRRASVVTTSMGGVITRTWLELPLEGAPPISERDEVGRFIACVPPFSGAPVARFHIISEIGQVLGDAVVGQFSTLFVWDGLGQAADDLEPDSSLMRRFRATTRRPDVRYSILAGAGHIAPTEIFDAAEEIIAKGLKRATPGEAVAWELLAEVIRETRAVSEGRGDGVVPLSSTRLAGVKDHVVVADMNHLDCLAGTETEGEAIPALDLVLKRLPAP